MNTIFILSQALAKAACADISRLDVQYNYNTETYSAIIWFKDLSVQYRICEDGTITKL